MSEAMLRYLKGYLGVYDDLRATRLPQPITTVVTTDANITYFQKYLGRT